MRRSILLVSASFVVTSLGIAALLAVSSSSAQTTAKGSIEGMAVDASGAAVPGVTVTATRQDGSSVSATTNHEGFFRMANLEPGTYTVTVEAEKGFAGFEQSHVSVNLSRATSLTLQLRPAGAAEAVTVTQITTGGTANVNTNGGVTTATFDTNAGKIHVYLPDDMRAGDVISGTVVAEPKGATETEKNTNLSQLKNLMVELKGPSVTGSSQPSGLADTIIFVGNTSENRVQRSVDGGNTWQIIKAGPVSGNAAAFTHPISSTAGPNIVQINLNKVTPESAPPGLVLSNALIPNSGSARFPYPSTSEQNPFSIPTLGQQGRPLEIFGPFDGDSSNTTLRFGPVGTALQDFEINVRNVSGGVGAIRPLAESPRKIVFQSPNVVGPLTLNVGDGNTESVGLFRNVGVSLSAPKTNLLKGEKTILTTQVTGLAGIKEPVPLTLEAKGVITMEGGMFQPLYIQPSQVGASGTYVTTRTITGIQAGGWEATSTVVTTPFNIVLRDPSPPQTLLVNSFTGDYVFCSTGSKLSGTGKIEMKGCILTLTHNAPDRRVFGRFDACQPVNNGRFSTVYSPGTTVDFQTVTDAKPPQTRLNFNPLGRRFEPVQDTSAFATCP